jgi:hypothetical protein
LFREEECVKKILTLALSHFVGRVLTKNLVSKPYGAKSKEQLPGFRLPPE